ncbi:hypothetical protein [Caulobacter sp. NIBR2454]|uniref:hypothetical protein n=1 Tax=Caulobacter sp. NIBR2454 TaxID=3015996 RepID=UPI0022B71E6A|nr:hypothetical protein [Caulobacter sp. NIBR2454]
MDQYAQRTTGITWSNKDRRATTKVRFNWTLLAALSFCGAIWAAVLWAVSAALN